MKKIVLLPDAAMDSEIFVGQSAAMQTMRRALRQLASTPATDVILCGEPGSGKRTFARELHRCTRGSGELLEPSEPKEVEAALKASGPATLYLGELTCMPSSLKVKIRRALYARRHRGAVRFVAAVTHTGVTQRAGDLLPSLLHRFSVKLELPPLRERLDDLPLLAHHLLARLATEQGIPVPTVSAAVLETLRGMAWPGNVRELENDLKWALLLAGSGCIEPEHLPSGQRKVVHYHLPAEGLDLQALERELLLQALRRARGNRTRAASLLGLTRDQVRYRLAKLAEPETGRGLQ